jgi:hypothetical protein
MKANAHRQRFDAKVARGRHPEDCDTWTGPLNFSGYGRFQFDGVRYMASHVALLLDGRDRPSGLQALHSCDNRKCVNPRHLRWGTPADNVRDAVERGRVVGHPGSANGNAKLTQAQVDEIRTSPETQIQVAARFGISQSMASLIRRGESWRQQAA